MRQTAITLADGRDLFYFDADGAPQRDQPDQRELAPTTASSEMRYDPLLDQWVIVAPHRQTRTFRPTAGDCPLCPSGPEHSTEVPAPDYEVVVFENRFRAMSVEAGRIDTAGAWGPARPAFGRCEVVCFTSDHAASFASLAPGHVDLIIAAWIARTEKLSAVPGIEQVFCFENRGQDIGVTLEHPHGQIYAYPFLTPRTRRMLESATAYLRRTGGNLFDDRLAFEVTDQARVVFRTDLWTALVPHAARWPYEVHLYPNRRVPDLAALTAGEQSALSYCYLDLVDRFQRLFDTPAPYISAWHQAPVSQGRKSFALHLELFTIRRANDKLKYLAGSESGMDVFANDVRPETAAQRLRYLGGAS